MPRRLLKLAFFILCLGIITLLITASLFATESGSRWLVYRVIDQNHIPLTIDKVKGRLLDEISFQGLHYLDRDGTEINADDIKLIWSPVDLLGLKVNVTSIDVDQLIIKIADSYNGMPEILRIDFPVLPVNIDKLELNNTRVLEADNEQLIVHARASLVTNNGKLVLHLEQMHSTDQELAGNVTLVRKKIPEIEINLQWSGTIGDKPGQGHLQLEGPQNNMALQFELESTIANINAHGNLDLFSTPQTGTLQGEISGELPQSLNNHIKPVSPLLFNLKGSTKFIEGNFITKLQTAAGVKMAFDMESYVALPGTSSNSLNINLNWKATPEQENPLFALSGEGDFEYRNNILTIDHQLKTPYTIQLRGNVDFKHQPDLDMKLDWKNIHLPVSDDSALKIPSGFLNVVGTLDSLAILAKTKFTAVSNITDNSTNDDKTAFSQLSVDGKLDVAAAFPTGKFNGTLDGPVPAVLKTQVKKLEPLVFNVALERENVDLTITGAGQSINNEPFELTLKSQLNYSQNNKDGLVANIDWSVSPTTESGHLEHIAGNGKLHYLNDHLTITHDLISPFPAKIDGDVVFNEDTESVIRFDINWQDLELPLQGHTPLLSDHGHLHLDGPVSLIAIEINSYFPSTPLGPAEFYAMANWSNAELNITRLNLKALEGNLQGTGHISTDAITRGRFDLDARNINLESINPDLVSEINLAVKLDFSLEENGLNGHLQVPSLSGDWRGHPLQGNAEVSRTANRIDIKSLHIESGKNTVDMQLDMRETLAGYIDLSITDMSIFSSELAGKVNGRFNIGGTVEAARIDGQLKGKNIYFFDLRIASLDADSLIDLRPQKNSSLEIRSGKIQYKQWLVDKLTLKGTGLTESHTLELTASGENLLMDARLEGQLHNKNWKGAINQLAIKTPLTGEWKLDRASEFSWQGETNLFTIKASCLEQKDASLCLKAEGDMHKDINATVQLNRLPMAMAQSRLPETVSLNGTVSGDIFLNRLNEHWGLQTSLKGTNTQISVGYDEEDADTLEVQQLSFEAEVTHNRREWNLQLSSPEYFDIRLEGSVQNTGTRPITADMKMDLYKIDWLAGIEPALTGSKGKFEARVNASGTVKQPVIQGKFSLRDGQLSIIPAGLNLDHISGELQSGNERSQMLINLVLESNGKQLQIMGDTRLDAEQNYPYQLHLLGEKFPLVRTADITMDVSPDLDLHGTMRLHHVRGNVDIPLLNMQVNNLPEDSVTVSPDTVIIQSKKAGTEPVEEHTRGSDFIRNQLDVDINVKLGPDILIQGFGLNTKMAGDINIVKPVGIYQPRGEGFVKLSDGSYRAYGQNLVIDKGQLQFAGPLDNPGINVYAYRPNLKVRPGIKVTGNIRQPKLSLYSVPALSDADTLSYLITGQPITGVSSNEDANLLAQAALTLGTQESSVLTNQIENMFGLEEFSVGTGETYQSTSVNATKKLSPNLTFKPSFNPFDQLWTFLLNYRLTDHWSVQAESGVSQGGDIIYSIDTNKLSELFRNIWSFGN